MTERRAKSEPWIRPANVTASATRASDKGKAALAAAVGHATRSQSLCCHCARNIHLVVLRKLTQRVDRQTDDSEWNQKVFRPAAGTGSGLAVTRNQCGANDVAARIETSTAQ